MLKQAENQDGDQATIAARGRVSRFGSTTDPVEAGRKGGRASVLSRRLRHQRQLEAKVAESRNGYAILKLAEKEARRNRELEHARIQADELVNRLMDEAAMERETVAELKQTIVDLRAEVDRLRNGRHALFVRVDALKAAIGASEPELVDRLKALDAAGGLDDVLAATGLLEPVPDGEPA